MGAFGQWWQALAERERLLFAAGAIAVSVMLGWAWLWQPLAAGRAALRGQIAEQRALRVWLEALPRAAPVNVPAAASGTASLLRVVDETLRAAGMAAAIERIEPEGSERVRVWLRAAPFDALIGWLEQLAPTADVEIDELEINREQGAAGQVAARLTLLRRNAG